MFKKLTTRSAAGPGSEADASGLLGSQSPSDSVSFNFSALLLF